MSESKDNSSTGAEQSHGATEPATTETPSSQVEPSEPSASPAIAPAGDESGTQQASVRPTVRWIRGGLPLAVGLFAEFCLAAADKQFRWGVPAGIVATMLATWGALDLTGSLDDAGDRVAHRRKIGELAPSLAAIAGTLLLTLALITVAVSGRTGAVVNGVLITASFLALVVSVYRFGERLGAWGLDETGESRSMFRRHGFWVVVAGTVLYLPALGSYSLSDPWETHYGEVAREILARDDWISTWWAQDGWFWSKPVLNFWTEALSMALFGVGYRPDQMLAAASAGRQPWPEWAVRMPVFILTIIALYLIYKGVAKVFGRRAGLLGALVLATTPHWSFLAHQTMTDMPFVASMTSSMGLLLLGLHTDPDQEVRVYEIDLGLTKIRLSAYHLVFGAILMAVIPQIVYLISRNIDLQLATAPHGFRIHAKDLFYAGSAGNCGLPGNQGCQETPAANHDMLPAYQGLLWAALMVLTLWVNRTERRLSHLYFLAAWFFGAVATMGKGPAGFGLPLLCAGAYLFATAKWKKLLDLELVSGILIVAVVALPWYVAMYMRHGQPFTDRLLFHDMWKRALTHVHDTNVGDDVSFRYFVWQLGYALFPWTGLVPAGLVWWARRRDDARGGLGDAAILLAMWFVFAFALFTAMLTKFHHYIFPAVPPAAMLTGIVLDRMLGERELVRPGRMSLAGYLAAMGLGIVSIVYGFFRLFPGRLMGTVEPDTMAPRPASPVVAVISILLGAAAVVVGAMWFGAKRAELPPGKAEPGVEDSATSGATGRGEVDATPDAKGAWSRRAYEDVILGTIGLAAAVVVALVGRDLVMKPRGDTVGQARLLHLFTYNYGRSWPESLEFTGMLAAFTLVGVGLMILLTMRHLRAHAVVATVAFGCVWALWTLDVYMVKTAPHWGQRETILAYYKDRQSPDEPVVAYQMNWKGENFYTGNRTPAFVSSGKKFTEWIQGERDKGVKTFYFVSEHGRRGGLKNELGTGIKTFDAITTPWLDNKFGIFKAVFE